MKHIKLFENWLNESNNINESISVPADVQAVIDKVNTLVKAEIDSNTKLKAVVYSAIGSKIASFPPHEVDDDVIGFTIALGRESHDEWVFSVEYDMNKKTYIVSSLNNGDLEEWEGGTLNMPEEIASAVIDCITYCLLVN
jgi:hypothetical protein